ncbi:hypothetical protein ACPV3O_00810 [Vibrio rotiferianus]|uniref:hypothetical protein n=1 Tax=Vibrio rotiferianus TaxID=190895 RepID=UPI00406A3811
MIVKHSLILLDGEKQVAGFVKSLEMPCLPPIGSKIFFGSRAGSGIGHTVESISFSEKEASYSIHYKLDVKVAQREFVDYVDVLFFVNLLYKRQGFSVQWAEDEYDHLFQ